MIVNMVVTHSNFLLISPSKVILLFQHSQLDMPSIKRIYLPHAFEDYDDYKIIGSHYSFLPSHLGIGKLKYVFYHCDIMCPTGNICYCTPYYLSFFNQSQLPWL